MKKQLLIIVLGLLWLNVANAESSFQETFNKALKNHQYYFKYKDKTYTTDTEEKRFDFFEHGYKNYREAAEYMLKNYPNDKSFSCFIFKGKLWTMYGWNGDNYLQYNKNGWKENVIAKSKDNIIKVVFYENSGCYLRNTYFKVFFDDKETYDSRTDFYDDREHLKDSSVTLNINYYIDKDYNNNGKQELFLDVGYAFGMRWNESYYLFEYDNDTIKLVKKIVASEWEERLGMSDHHKAKFEVSEEELAKIIIEKFK